jgi:hypothetical protein
MRINEKDNITMIENIIEKKEIKAERINEVGIIKTIAQKEWQKLLEILMI